MKIKSMLSILACFALSVCLITAYAPDSAYAASDADAQTLTAGTVSTKTTAKKKTPKPKKVSAVKLSSKKVGKATISWKASKVKGLKKQTYTVRYAYNKSMKNAKTKTVKAKSLSLSKLKQGKKLYVQIRTNAKYGKKTLHSKWSGVKAVKVKAKIATKPQPTNPSTPTTPTNPASPTTPTNPSTPAPAKTWVPEQGHWEPVYTTIVDQEAYTTYTRVYYTEDGWSGTSRDEAYAHHYATHGNVWWEDVPEYHPAVTHQEQTGQRWIVDVPGHWA